MKMKRLTITVALMTSISAVANTGVSIDPYEDDSNVNDSNGKTIQSLMSIIQPQLGMGFNSAGNELTNIRCVAGTETEFGPVKESVRLLVNESIETIRSELSGRADVGIGLGGFSLDAGGLINRRSISGDYSSNYSFVFQGVSERRVLLPFDTSNVLLDSHYDTSGCASIFSGDNSEAIVGDEFVNSILLGGLLKFDLTMTAKSKRDIDVLKGQLKMGVNSGFHLDVSGAEEQGINLNEVRITMSLNQQGGRPEMLQQAVGDSAVSCRASNWEVCTELYTEAINYAFNNFPNQFDNGGNEYIISYTTVKYKDARISNQASLNGGEEIRQLSVLLFLRGKYDQALSYLSELVTLEASQSEIAAAESEVTSLESQYRLCQQNHLYCDSVTIN